MCWLLGSLHFGVIFCGLFVACFDCVVGDFVACFGLGWHV